MKRKLILGLILMLGGCVHPGKQAGSYDGLSDEYVGDSKIFAEHVAGELENRYTPARTTIRLAKAPGAFGNFLENDLRTKGFAVSQSSGVNVSYHLDLLDAENQPTMGFVQVKADDGQFFSFSREVFRGTEPPVDLPSRTGFDEKNLPQSTTTAQVSPPKPTPALYVEPEDKKYTVKIKKGGTARQVAKRYGIATENFCAWNKLDSDSILKKGNRVYLMDPLKIKADEEARERELEAERAEKARKEEARRQEEARKLEEARRQAELKREEKPRTQVLAGGTNTNQNQARTYTVKKNVQAGKLADQLGIKRKDFLAWNQAGSHAEYKPGDVVFISKPDGFTPQSYEAPAHKSPKVTEPKSKSSQLPREEMQPKNRTPQPVTASFGNSSPQIVTYDNKIEQTWEVVGGTMLRSILENWTAIAGYTLVWNPDNDYEMRTSATFTGNFETALRNFFAQLQMSGLALRATIYRGNNVLEISDK